MSLLTANSEQPILEINAYGDKFWRLNGERHREDGPAVEWADGYKAWFLNGKRHRTDGPAVEDADGNKEWYLNGKRHREDGPAIEWANGYKEWYLNGVIYSLEDYCKELYNDEWEIYFTKYMLK